MSNDFEIGICGFYDCKSLIYANACVCCALADSRHYLDGSSFWYNLCCIPIAPYRWMVRSAYGIGDKDSCWADFFFGCCCGPCTVHQLYVTTKVRGRPCNNGGKEFNTNPVRTLQSSMRQNGCCYRPEETTKQCCCAFWCMPCVNGTILQESMGMPFHLGCCCMPFFAVKNVVRYQYRMGLPNDEKEEFEECCKPILLSAVTGFVNSLSGVPIGTILYHLWVTALNIELQKDVEERKHRSNKGYLVGFSSNDTHLARQVSILPTAVVEAEMVVTNKNDAM